MKLDIYHLYEHFDNVNFVPPLIPNILRLWSLNHGWSVRMKEAREHSVNLETDADVVAMSVYTQAAPMAYRLCKELRKRGKIVILGGPHFRGPYIEEAKNHCDVVVHTISEQQWYNLLDDIEKGNVGPQTQSAGIIVDNDHRFILPKNFSDCFAYYKWYQIPSLPATLGCPYDCEYCNPFLKGEYKLRDIDTISKELEKINRKTILLCDATFGLNKKHTINLMSAISGLKKKLLIETPLATLADKEILKALGNGGVRIVSVGIETLSMKLGKHGGFNVDIDLNRVINECHEYGISVQGNFILGLDYDGPDSFKRVYDFYNHSKLDFVFCDILTPYPNTLLFDRLLKENRIIDENWSHYDYRHVVFQPKNMTVSQLKNGFISLYKDITKPGMVLKKVKSIIGERGLSVEACLALGGNIFNRFDALRKERMFNQSEPRGSIAPKTDQTQSGL